MRVRRRGRGRRRLVYVAVLGVICLPTRWALVLTGALAVTAEVLGHTLPGWSSPAGLTFAICTAAFAMWGVSQLMQRNVDLLQAEEENARLAVADERNRFARDLHDILGHSLTVITVKAELANRLLDVDPERARAELVDLERLSRDALADVRRAVEGYRDLTLPGRAGPGPRGAAGRGDRRGPAEQHRRGALGAARAVRVDGARGRHQRDPAQRGVALHRAARVLGRRGARRRRRAAGADPRRHRARRSARARCCGRCRAGDAHPRPARVRVVGDRPVIRLLLADDQALVRGALAALLDLEPDLEVVAEVGSGDDVLPAAHEHRPDVALLDVEMPGLDGIDATRVLRAAMPEVRVLIVTTFGRPGFLRRALQAGADGFVVKDTPARQLADAVRRVHAGLRVVDPVLAADSLVAGDSPLTARETDVLRAAREGASVAVVAARLFLSEGTVRNHLSAAIGKTGAANRAEAARIADGNGWL